MMATQSSETVRSLPLRSSRSSRFALGLPSILSGVPWQGVCRSLLRTVTTACALTTVGCVKEGTTPLEERVRAMRERRASEKSSNACVKKAIDDSGYSFDETHSDRTHLVSKWETVPAPPEKVAKGKKAAHAPKGVTFVRVVVSPGAAPSQSSPASESKAALEAKVCPSKEQPPSTTSDTCLSDPAFALHKDTKFELLKHAVLECTTKAPSAPPSVATRP